MKSLNVVITGASRGIGFELTRQCLERGANVIAGVRSPARASDLVNLKSSAGERLTILAVDVTSDESVESFADGLKMHKIDRVDILINNAGVYLDDNDSLDTLTSETIIDTFNTNVFGVVRMTRAMLPFLRQSRQPKVVSISSLMGSIADNAGGGSFAYRMSKSAVNMFTKTLAVDERDILSLAMHPGWVKTEMGGERAPLSPEKSAEGILTVIETSTLGDTGKFFNHAGRELPW